MDAKAYEPIALLKNLRQGAEVHHRCSIQFGSRRVWSSAGRQEVKLHRARNPCFSGSLSFRMEGRKGGHGHIGRYSRDLRQYRTRTTPSQPPQTNAWITEQNM